MFICLLSPSARLLACDACGGGASNMGVGLLLEYRSNFVRLGFFNARFQSHPEHEYLVTDNFTQASLSFRYAVGKNRRIRITGQLPVGRNARTKESFRSEEFGLADSRLVTNYVICNRRTKGFLNSLYLESGVGLSLPTGRYDSDIHDKNLPENFNLGRGSLGTVFQLNTALDFGKFGLVFNNDVQWNSQTRSGYQFGHQYSSQLVAFKEFQLKKMQLIPNTGLAFETIALDRYPNGKQVPETGGNGLFLSAALNFKTEKWLAGCSYANPLAGHYSEGAVLSRERVAVHFSFLF